MVHVIHAADGMIPSDMATGDAESIEEVRRLLYVALSYAQLSRVLDGEVRTRFDQRTITGPAHAPDATTNVVNGTPAVVEAYLAGLFATG